MTHPDFIAIDASRSARLEASHADFLITISGSSLFSGETALHKAREVADLVTELRGIGIEEKQIRIESVRAETQSGTFTKSSSAYYALRIENLPVARVTEGIGVIASAKNVKLNHIQWRFSDELSLRDELRQACLQTALERARNIALTLGVRLLGIYEMEEKWSGTREETSSTQYDFDTEGAAMVRRKAIPELGMAVSHAETVRMELNFKFRISGFA